MQLVENNMDKYKALHDKWIDIACGYPVTALFANLNENISIESIKESIHSVNKDIEFIKLNPNFNLNTIFSENILPDLVIGVSPLSDDEKIIFSWAINNYIPCLYLDSFKFVSPAIFSHCNIVTLPNPSLYVNSIDYIKQLMIKTPSLNLYEKCIVNIYKVINLTILKNIFAPLPSFLFDEVDYLIESNNTIRKSLLKDLNDYGMAQRVIFWYKYFVCPPTLIKVLDKRKGVVRCIWKSYSKEVIGDIDKNGWLCRIEGATTSDLSIDRLNFEIRSLYERKVEENND